MRWYKGYAGIVLMLLAVACSAPTPIDRREINQIFGSCPLEIGVRLFGGLEELRPIQLERQTPSLLNRVTLGSKGFKEVLIIGGARTYEEVQGKITPANFQSLKDAKEIRANLDELIEAPAMLAFYRVDASPFKQVVTGLRFDLIGKCIINTMFTFTDRGSREQVEAAMRDLSFVARDRNR